MAEKNVYSVGQVNRYIKNMFAEDFFLRNIAVTGEISNLKYHSSGHIFFTLKDAEGEIKGIMFRGKAAGLKFRMKDGDKVIVSGSIEVYDKGGTYQIYANTIQLAGAGDLYLRFEELKKELAEMGMFAPEYKKPIPKFARRIGIITAPTGAAVRDIIQISKRRNPYVELILCPTLVQGEGAVASICESIARMDALGLDVLIVGRGGGSIEDLWAFNEEEVARAIFGCNTPVISAVGHETDTTIADYVADLRAPTPSAAAELAVFDMGLMEANLADYRARMQSAMQQRLQDARVRMTQHSKHLSLLSPENQLNQKRQRLAEVERRVAELMERRLEDARMRLDGLQSAIPSAMEAKLTDRRHRFEMLAARLDGSSPVKKFAQGYSYTVNADGKNISSTDDVAVGDELTVYLREGKLGVEVKQKI
ncbi:MAG: exodeoxyribonuclease VII large subunit [Lachnospiraceae bacterium]|nr:exodeoxyribonuclease VII large subunit [Lachnospiraceae bacterium]